MKILALVESLDHVCCRYRIASFLPRLSSAGIEVSIEGIQAGLAARYAQLRRAKQFDAVLLQRKLLDLPQFQYLRANARKLIFDFDDAVFLRDSFHRAGSDDPRRMARFKRIVTNADLIISGNDFLAARAIHAGAVPERVHRVPTCLSVERYPMRTLEQSSSLRLVWIGSASTLEGLKQRQGLWDQIAKHFPEAVLNVVSDRRPQLGQLRVELIPWSIPSEARNLSQSDIGISMVPDDLWSRGKCGLKVLQYMAAGLPVIADPVGVHHEMIAQDQTGYLPRSDEDWLEALSTLRTDTRLRQLMGQRARLFVNQHYDVSQWEIFYVELLKRCIQDLEGVHPSIEWNRSSIAIDQWRGSAA